MREIPVSELEIKPIRLFNEIWGALTSGSESTGWNSMTISWGSIGVLWGRKSGCVPVCNVYVRPSRFTFHLMKENDMFTVSFMDESHRAALAYLGSASGADDPDKIKTAGLSVAREGETAYLEGSDLVLVCRKVYNQAMSAEQLLDRELLNCCYSDPADFHDLFVGEIVKVLVKD